MKLVLRGLSNKQIAKVIGVTEKTVKFHLTNIFSQKLVRSRAELIVKETSEKITLEELKLFRELILG